jgi:hypothetical protein
VLRPVLVGLIAVGLLTSCSSGTVAISFHPKLGARYAYELQVHTESVTRLEGQAARTRTDDVRLRVDQQVLESGPDGVRVRVRLTATDGASTTFVVRFDRAAQPAEVQQTEGLPSSVLGGLGLSEVFPAAAGAPPRRGLRPGTRWSIDQMLSFGGAAPTRLVGSGWLVRLGVVNRRNVATVRTSYRLPLQTAVTDASGEVSLNGAESSQITTTRALADGAVEKATAHTTGDFNVVVRPPTPDTAAPVSGRITVDVTSTTRRVSASR